MDTEKTKLEVKEKDFVWVMETHKNLLYKIANMYCKDSQDQNDLVQDIILQLWKSFDKYNNQYKYSTWIYRIALNMAINFYKKEKRKKGILHPISHPILNIAESNLHLEQDYEGQLLQKFIAELKEVDKALIILYLEEKNYKEIAEIMGISETNVSTKIGRIKASLKQKFSTIKD
jgi:RNA polymerase sigma-70 factor (ECF subfamily)